MNYILDNNVIIDLLSERRKRKYSDSLAVFDTLKEDGSNIFISTASIDNIEFILFKELQDQFNYTNKEALDETHKRIKEFLKQVKIAKNPSYIEIDYDDIEDSQIIASAKAIDALVLTRDEKMLQKHPAITITPTNLQKTTNQKPETKNQKPTTSNQQPETNNQQPKTKIDFANLKKQHFLYQDEIEKEIDQVLTKANFIMGEPVKELEKSLEAFTGARHAITCSSGTDALLLAMMALDIKPGDEIITTPFTFIATAETIALLGAKPVFVDIDEETYNIDPTKIEAAITPKTKAIIPVSLYGQPADMDAIQKIVDNTQKTKNQKLTTIIDGAQSFGATYKGKAEVHHCDIYTTSFFPAKPLGCYGDGGAVLTNNQELATKIQQLRVHGQNKRYHHKYIGFGARLDTIQAAVLNVKLKHYPKDLKQRQKVAEKYTELFNQNNQKPATSNQQPATSNQKLILPKIKPDRTSTFAQYSIRIQPAPSTQHPATNLRDELIQKLKTSNQQPETNTQKPATSNQKPTIPTAVHYPMPLHLQECFADLAYKEGDFPVAEKVSKEILSLPMNPYLTDDEIGYITEEVLHATNR